MRVGGKVSVRVGASVAVSVRARFGELVLSLRL